MRGILLTLQHWVLSGYDHIFVWKYYMCYKQSLKDYFLRHQHWPYCMSDINVVPLLFGLLFCTCADKMCRVRRLRCMMWIQVIGICIWGIKTRKTSGICLCWCTCTYTDIFLVALLCCLCGFHVVDVSEWCDWYYGLSCYNRVFRVHGAIPWYNWFVEYVHGGLLNYCPVDVSTWLNYYRKRNICYIAGKMGHISQLSLSSGHLNCLFQSVPSCWEKVVWQ